jgi:anti-sigma B factor antagonist
MSAFPAAGPVFDCHVQAAGDTTTVTLTGELDGAAAERLTSLTSRMSAFTRVVVDVRAVSFVDSMGLRVLVDWHHRLSGDGGELELAEPSAALQRLLTLTSLDEMFTIRQQPRPTE